MKEVQLTKRRFEVVKLFSEGLCTKEIAATLGISATDVAYHVNVFYRKTGARNLADLTRYAIRFGISILSLTLLLTGCKSPPPVYQEIPAPPPMPEKFSPRSTNMAMTTAMVVAPSTIATVVPLTQSWRLSWDYWTDGARFATYFPETRITINYTRYLPATNWIELTNLPPTATNFTVTLPTRECGFFRTGYTW